MSYLNHSSLLLHEEKKSLRLYLLLFYIVLFIYDFIYYYLFPTFVHVKTGLPTKMGFGFISL